VRKTLQQQISANRNLSLLYCLLLVVLLAALGAPIAGYFDPELWPWGVAGAGLLGLVVALVSWRAGPRLVLRVSQARNARPIELQRLGNVAEEMAIAAGIPVPQVYLIDDSAANAFATGRGPREGVVVFTTGLVEKLDRDELQGVMAHEIAHIRNNDIRLMTTLAIVAGLIPLLADFYLRMIWWGGRGRSRGNNQGAAILALIGLALAILAPVFAKILELAVSRRREYMADATAAELTRYPEGLARALDKISGDRDVLEVANRATEHLYIVNPFKPFETRARSMFSTHPPIQDRIARLRQMAGAHAQPAPSDEITPREGAPGRVPPS
jgi:heat shock protein HtpX